MRSTINIDRLLMGRVILPEVEAPLRSSQLEPGYAITQMAKELPLGSLPRVFAVISWGCAGTHWLSAVLKSHPDIFSIHNGKSYLSRAQYTCSDNETVNYMKVVCGMGRHYKAAGDIHSVSRHDVSSLKQAFGDYFEAVIVVRDPMPRLQSQLSLFAGSMARGSRHYSVDYISDVLQTAAVTLPKDDYEHRLFVHGVNMLNAIVEERSVGTIYRIEDLTGNLETLARFVHEVSSKTVRPSDEWLEASLTRPRVASHRKNHEDLAFADWQAEVIRKVVKPEAWELYRSLGYSAVVPD